MRPTLVQIPFSSGQDESVDERSQPPGVLTLLQNARQSKYGVVSKRTGYSPSVFSTTSYPVTSEASAASHADVTFSGTRKLANISGELLAITDHRLLSWSPAQSRWLDRDEVSEAICRRETISQSSGTLSEFDYAVAGNFEIFTWVLLQPVSLSGEVFVSIRDITTGTFLFADYKLNVGIDMYTPRIAVAGTTVFVVYQNYTTKDIFWNYINLATSRTWTYSGVTGFTTVLEGCFEVTSIPGTSDWALGWIAASGALRLRINRISATGTAISNTSIAGEAAVGFYGAIGFTNDGTNYCFTYQDSTTVAIRMAVVSNTYTAVVAPRSVGNTATNTVLWFSSCASDGLGGWYILGYSLGSAATAAAHALGVYCWSYSAGGVDSSLGQVVGAGPGSKPFAYKGRAYAFVYHDNNTSMALVQFAAGYLSARPVAWFSMRIAGRITGFRMASVGQVAASTFVYPGTTVADAANNGNGYLKRLGLSRVQADFEDQYMTEGADYPINRSQTVQWGDMLLISGGVPSYYDGVRVAELAFSQVDGYVSTGRYTAAAGGAMADGIYTYRYYYEHTDATGVVHRSALSVPAQVTLGGGNNKVQCYFPTLSLTRRQSDAYPSPAVALVVLRSTANGSSGVLYRVTQLSVPPSNLNDPTSAYLNFYDNTADNLAAPVAYNTGGLIEGVATPSLFGLTKHRRRVAGIGDDLRTVWISSEYEEREAPRFNELTTTGLDERITALGSLDDKLILFAKDNIYVIYGDGPSPTGVNSDWTSPQKVPSDVGCIEPRSIVTIPDGLLFLSAKGFYLLSRKLQVVQYSKQIQDTLAQYPTVISATVAQEDDLVIWECRALGSTTVGISIVYNYVLKFWSVDFRPLNGGVSAPPVTGAVLYRLPTDTRAFYHIATSSGQVYREVPALDTDNGNYFPMAVETAWIATQGPHAFQRVRKVEILGKTFGSHSTKLELAFDLGASYVQSYTWSGLTTAQSERFVMRVGSQNGANPRCAAIRVRLSNPAGPYHPEWSGIALEVVPMTDAARRPATVKV